MQSISDLLIPKVRVFLVLTSLSALFFIETYCTSVCSFIDGLSKYELFFNLTLILLFHLMVRELLYRLFSKPWKKVSLVRQAYYLSMLSWVIAGVGASLLHALRYPYFPAGSHLKLLSSYWILGAGVLAQLEYVIFEHYYLKNAHTQNILLFKEQLGRRILESLIIFTMAPTVTMLLTVMRYNYEGILSHHVATELLYIGLLSVLAAITVAYLIGTMLKKDTQEIVNVIKAVESGNFTQSVTLQRADELGEIAQGISSMSHGLRLREQIREAFGRFVNPQIASTFIDHFVKEDSQITMGGSKQHVVVLMADIRGFTTLSEGMEPDKLITLLNAYFAVMVEAVHQENGIVDKFIGDAIMAVFGIPECQEPELAAVRCAKTMRQNLKKLNQSFSDQGLPTLDNGIGIHGGEVVAGYLGSQERLEFTVIGSTVNIASRIEQQTKLLQQPILISEAIHTKVASTCETAFVESVTLKGLKAPMKLYAVTSVKEGS